MLLTLAEIEPTEATGQHFLLCVLCLQTESDPALKSVQGTQASKSGTSNLLWHAPNMWCKLTTVGNALAPHTGGDMCHMLLMARHGPLPALLGAQKSWPAGTFESCNVRKLSRPCVLDPIRPTGVNAAYFRQGKGATQLRMHVSSHHAPASSNHMPPHHAGVQSPAGMQSLTLCFIVLAATLQISRPHHSSFDNHSRKSDLYFDLELGRVHILKPRLKSVLPPTLQIVHLNHDLTRHIRQHVNVQ